MAYAQIFQTLLNQQVAAGEVLAGGKAYFYTPNTSNLATIYTDRNMGAPAANPATLSANGNVAVFGNGQYDVKITDSALAQKYYWYGVSLIDVSETTALKASFDAYVADTKVAATDGRIATVYDVAKYASLPAAITSIGSTKSTLRYSAAISLSADLTIPANVELQPYNGAVITIASGKLLTINGPFNPGPYPVFAGDGNAIINNSLEVCAAWWGAEPDNVAVDNGAIINKALASSIPVKLGVGTYSVSTTILMDKSYQQLTGVTREQTLLNYTGSTCCIQMGPTIRTNTIALQKIKDLCVYSRNTSSPAQQGILVSNSLYFTIDDVSVFGAFTWADPGGGDSPLLGHGIQVTNNSIIGKINHCNVRLCDYGIFFGGTSGDDIDDTWTAAIEVSGQCAIDENNIGIVIGHTNAAFDTGAVIAIQNNTLQSNHYGAIVVNTGNVPNIKNNYFENNALFDIQIGSSGSASQPIMAEVCGNSMPTGNSSVAGDGAYTCKVTVLKGFQTLIDHNDMSIGTAIPLVRIASGAENTIVTNNRLNSTNATTDRYVDNGVHSVFRDNSGPRAYLDLTLLNSWAAVTDYEAPGYRKVGNEVILQGQIQSGSVGTTIATLPANYRPALKIDFTTGGGVLNCFTILSDGSIICTVKGSSTVSLSGIRFYIF